MNEGACCAEAPRPVNRERPVETANTDVYDVSIKKVVNGCIVAVGCKTFVFNDTDKACQEISAYLKDPVATIKRYKEEYKF